MKKLNKILISLASVVSISSLPMIAASCGAKKKEVETSNSGNQDSGNQDSGTKPSQKDQDSGNQDSETKPSQKDQDSGTKPSQKDQDSGKQEPGTKSKSKPRTKSQEGNKNYNFPALKAFIEENSNELFEIGEKDKVKKELEGITEKHVLIVVNGDVKIGTGKKGSKKSGLKLNPKFNEWGKVNTHGANSNIGHKWSSNKKGIKITKNEDDKIELEWQLYLEDGTKDNKIYKQEISLK